MSAPSANRRCKPSTVRTAHLGLAPRLLADARASRPAREWEKVKLVDADATMPS